MRSLSLEKQPVTLPKKRRYFVGTKYLRCRDNQALYRDKELHCRNKELLRRVNALSDRHTFAYRHIEGVFSFVSRKPPFVRDWRGEG
jgi:hypothetical protein